MPEGCENISDYNNNYNPCPVFNLFNFDISLTMGVLIQTVQNGISKAFIFLI